MDSNQRSQKITDDNAISQNPDMDLHPEAEETTHDNVTTLDLKMESHPGSEQNSGDIDITKNTVENLHPASEEVTDDCIISQDDHVQGESKSYLTVINEGRFTQYFFLFLKASKEVSGKDCIQQRFNILNYNGITTGKI